MWLYSSSSVQFNTLEMPLYMLVVGFSKLCYNNIPCVTQYVFMCNCKLQDAFQHGNVVQLLVRSNGYPLRICNKELMAFGNFTPECKSLLFNLWRHIYVHMHTHIILGSIKSHSYCVKLKTIT